MDELIYDNNKNDIKVYAVVRRRNRSALLVQFLNRFGEIGGYQKILDKINQDDNDATTIELVFFYLDAITAASSMFNKVFLDDYIPKLEKAVKKKILTASQAALRQVKKERIDGIVHALLGSLKGRLGLSYQEREQEMCLFNLEIASLFLKQQFLEKRIDGAKIISDVCKTANLSTFTSSTEVILDPIVRSQRLSFAGEVISKLKEGKVLFEIFSQERGHSELVQRSEELLKLFITQNSLSQEELEYVWASTKLDETTRLELFKHFHELSSRLRENEILYIIDQLDKVPLHKIVMQEIELVHELSKRTRGAETLYGPKAIDYFWKIAFSSQENIEKSNVNQAVNAISDIIKNWDNEKKHILVEKIIDNLKNNVEGLLSIKMLKKTLMNFSQSVELITINSSNKNNYQADLEDIMSNDKPQHQQQPQSQNQQNDDDNDDNLPTKIIPEQYKSKNNYICHLEYTYNLLELFFQNFMHYLFKARSVYRKKCEHDSNYSMKSVSDVVLCEKFIHSEQISERLEFLRYIISNSQVSFQTHQLSQLWTELIVHALTVQDTDMFYKWLKEICDDFAQCGDKNDVRALVEFFQEKFSQETNVFKTLTQEGFNCIQSFLILVNEFNEKMIRVVNLDNVQVKKFTAFNNVTGKEFKSYSFNQSGKPTYTNDDEELDFLINTEPSNIDGIQAVWKISTEANEQRVYEKAMQLLVKLYSQVTYKYVKHLPDYDDEFVSTCIQHINEYQAMIVKRQEQPKDEYEKVEKTISAFSSITGTSLQKILPQEERKIMRYLQLMKEYIKQSERLGTLGVKSHSSLLRGELLHSIQVSSSLGYGKESKKFEIAVQSNTTLYDFRKIVAKLNSEYSVIPEKQEDGSYSFHQMIIPDLVTLYRYTGVTILKDLENGKTLSDLKFKPNEQLNAYENKTLNNQTIPLLTPDRTELSENARLVFTEVFERFSIPDEDDPTKRIMNKQTCALFIQKCTEEDLVTDEDLRVLGLFEMYDTDHDDKIQLSDFLEFYKSCCFTKEAVVRDNLSALKFRFNLTSFREDYHKGLIIFQQREKVEDMPRYKLANNQIYFDSLFVLLDNQNDIANSAWNLIKQMTTKPDLYKKIKNLNQDGDFSWDQVIDSSSIYKILYTLQIIESMLEDVPESQKNNFELIQEKSVWIERFLSVGGFQEILKLFEVSLKLISQKPIDLLSKFEKNFLEYMLKLIRIFIMSAFAANDATVFELINLVKKSSSIQEKDDQQKQENTSSQQQDVKATEVQTGTDQYTTPNKKNNQSLITNLPSKQVDLANVPITEDLLFGQDFVGVGDNNVAVEVKDGQKINSSANNQQHTLSQQRTIENENERFSELAKIMRETGLGETIIEKINFNDLQKEILEIISLILSKKEINNADAMILENNFSLWVAILVKNDDLINDFYGFERSDDKAGMFGVKNADNLITTGLYTYKSFRVREEVTNTLSCIAAKVQSNKGKLMIFYLLDLLEKNFPREDQYYLTRESKAFFELFTNLIDEYFNYKKQKQQTSQLQKEGDINEYDKINQYDMYNLLKIAIEKMKRHQTKETRSSLVEDKTLIGYFNIIEKLVVYLQADNKQKLQDVINETGVLHELFYEQLFFDPKSLMKLDNKCKTKESRATCYSVLQKVIEALEPKELAVFLENDLWGILKDLTKPKTWKYVPSDNSKQSTSYVGIRNLGNICYMIAMLQQFFMVPQFRYGLLKAEEDSKPDMVQYRGMSIDDNMLRQLQRMFGYLELSEKQEFNPTEFCFSFKDYEGNPTNTAIQADTQEFLNIFFDRLENTLKPTSQRFLLDGVFGGNNCSQLICQSCGNIKNIKENFYNLSVPVKDRKSLDNSLSKMIEGSIINDYKCGACDKKVDVFKRTLIGETPNVLIVHLQRLVFNFDTFQNDKINTRFEFPNTLNLKDYSFKNVMNQEGKQVPSDSPSEDENQEYVEKLMQMDDAEYIYKLVGVIIHRGTGQHGHYWSLINTKRGTEELDENKPEWVQTERDTWREFNDETVKFFSFSDLKQEAFGGSSDGGAMDMHDDEMSSYLFNIGGASSYGKNAYILVYERQKKKDLIVLQKKTISEQSDSALECADTANSRVDQQQEQVEEFEQVLQPYRKIDPFIPDWIRAEVSHDNVIFLMDRYIYCEPFFNLLKSIFKHIANKVLLCQHHYSLDYIPYFTQLKRITMKLAHKSVFELLAYYYYNSQLSDILNSLTSIIQFTDSSYSLSRGHDSILTEFLELAFFSDSISHFMKVALECTDKSSRYYVCKLTTVIVNKVYRLWDEAENKDTEALQQLKAQVDSLIVHFVATLGEPTSYQNWSRMEQFMRMLYEIAQGGHSQARRFLSSTDVIPHLIEYTLGNRSPQIKSGKQRKPLSGEEPYFEPLVQLICLLTRYTLTKEMIQNEDSWNEDTNPPPFTLLGYDRELRDRHHRFETSSDALFYYFQSIFVDYIQYMGFDTLAVGNMLAHLSYKSMQNTRYICESQLRGISKNDIDRVKNYLDVVTQLVLIRDSLQQIKLEWIFGIAQPVSYDQITSHQDGDNDEDDQPKTRIGVKVLFSSNDEVFSYRSYLFTQDNIDSLLHLLWRYKGRLDAYTVNCLLSLMSIITQDDNVAEYFSNIPGPTYQYARYTDWIKPYLNEQLIDARKGYAGSFSQQKEENVIKALSLYETYEKYLENKDGVSHTQNEDKQAPSKYEAEQETTMIDTSTNKNQQSDNIEENVKNLIDQIIDTSTTKVTTLTQNGQYQTKSNQSQVVRKQTVIPCTPQPYIIVDCIKESYEGYLFRNSVQLQTISLDCTFTKSEPTGLGNLSMPKNLFTNFREVHNYGNKQNKHREQELQSKCIDNYFQSSNIKNKIKGTSNNNQNENDYGSKIIKDEDKQWRKVNDQNVYDIDDDETGYTQDNEDNYQKDNMQDADNYDGGKRHNSGIDEGLDIDDNDLQNLNLQDNQNEVQHQSQGVQGATNNDNRAQNLLDLDQQEDNQQNNQQQQQQEPVTYKINILEEGQVNGNNDNGQEFQVEGQIQYNDSNDNQPLNDDDNQETQTQQEIVWPNGVIVNQGLVLKYVATNTGDYPVKICIEFVDPYVEIDSSGDDENSHQNNNQQDNTLLQERYRYPKGLMEYYLNQQQTKTLLFVQKCDPWNENNQGTFEKQVRLSVVQLDRNMNDNNNYDSNPQNNQNNNGNDRKDNNEPESQQLQVIDETEDQGMDPQINVSDSNIHDVIDGIPQNDTGGINGDDYGNEPIMVDGMKQCKACTFLNEVTNMQCDICETRF